LETHLEMSPLPLHAAVYPANFQDPKEVETIFLRRCHLESLSSSISTSVTSDLLYLQKKKKFFFTAKFQNLKQLDLSWNLLSQFPSEMIELKLLSKLKFPSFLSENEFLDQKAKII